MPTGMSQLFYFFLILWFKFKMEDRYKLRESVIGKAPSNYRLGMLHKIKEVLNEHM